MVYSNPSGFDQQTTTVPNQINRKNPE